MKLELKHILPYANHGLRGEFLGKVDILHSIDLEDSILSSLNNNNCLISDFTPYLLPIQYLFNDNSKSWNRLETKFIPDSENVYKLRYGISDKNQTISFFYENGKLSTGVPYEFWQCLFEMHIDIFGLIQTGLAKSINNHP